MGFEYYSYLRKQVFNDHTVTEVNLNELHFLSPVIALFKELAIHVPFGNTPTIQAMLSTNQHSL